MSAVSASPRSLEVPLAAGLLAAVPLAALVAWALGRSAALAAVGASLVLVYWLLERAFAVLGARGPFGQGLIVGLAGMAARLALVMGVLVAVGMLDRPQFVECAVAFLAVFTLYFFTNVLLVVARPGHGSGPSR